MKIDLEKYLRSKRDQLDDVEQIDIDQMWDNFGQKNKPVKRIKPWYYMAAAAVVMLLGVSLFINNNSNNNHDDLVYQKLIEIDPILATEQASMTTLVSEQDSLIKNLGITEMQFPELFKEIETLDSLQIDYLNDLDNFRDRKNLTRTLLRHYQTKARIFELMLNEFDKQEKESGYENAKNI